MRRMIFCVAAALALAGCGISASDAVTSIPTPAEVADSTVIDEQIGITAALGYTAASKLGSKLVTAGLIDKDQFKAADSKGYAAVQAIKAAYKAGNATDYLVAVAQANKAIAEIRDLVK